MKVLSVQTYNYTDSKEPNFKAHPDLKILKRNYPEQYKVSCWFRFGVPVFDLDNYQEVINCLDSLDWSSPKRMLIAGIGDSQEPFSYLAVIKNITKKPLEDVVDLNIVDLQNKPNRIKLYTQSFYDRKCPPIYAPDSFVEAHKYRKLFGLNPKYRVNDEIFEYLKTTYSNLEKSKWETPVQEAVQKYSENSFDIISINNVFCYIKRWLVQPVINNIDRILKPNGIVITDDAKSICNIFLDTMKYEQLNSGIFRKIAVK